MASALFRSAVVLVCVLAACGPCTLLQAQGKDTVWTRVSADGAQLTLSWDKSHPWSKDMDGRGAELVARYRTAGGREVSERLAAGQADREDRRLTFTLPDGVRSRVEGPVCLFLQVAGRRVLPVRRSDRANADTGGFRYPAWDARVLARAEADVAREGLAAAERALAIADGNLSRQRTAAAERHWTTLEACDAPSVRAAGPPVKPYSVVEPGAQDDIARRVCVHRTYVTSQGLTNSAFHTRVQARLAELARQRDRSQAQELLLEAFFAGVDVFEVAGRLFDRLKASGHADAAFLRDREPQAVAFLLDWQRWQPTLARYAPHLGRPGEKIGWPSTAAHLRLRLAAPWLRETFGADAVWALAGVEPPTFDEAQAIVGAALDAYHGCVADTRSQLATNYEAWQTLVASEPARAATEREFLIRDCRAGVTRLTELLRELARFEAQLLEARAAAARADRPLPPLAARAVVLNAEACTP